MPAPCAAGARLEGVVRDDGRGLRGRGPGLRGLERRRARLEARGGTLCLQDGPGGSGGVLRFALPLSGGPSLVPVAARVGAPRGPVGPVTPGDHADPHSFALDPG